MIGLVIGRNHTACNALCRPDRGEHADVMWATADLDEVVHGGWHLTAMEQIHRERGCRPEILSIEDAPEAPEFGLAGTGPHRRLVRWREPIAQMGKTRVRPDPEGG